jgi:hypothetical protein
MAGYNARFLYDQCTFDQNLKTTTEPCRYQLMGDKFENQNMTIKNGPCKDKTNVGCKKCDTNGVANIEAQWNTIGLRTDIESDLLIINRPNTRCVNLKYHQCGPTCNKKYCSKKCPDYVVVNTRICDRHIVPTNLSMPLTNGF